MSYQKLSDGLIRGRLMFKFLPHWAALAILAGCGGGDRNPLSAAQNPTYQAGTYQPSATYHNHCAAPRSGTSDVSGSTTWENFWLRAWTHELYLWYGEVPDIDPSSQSDPLNYFDLMKTSAITPSGSSKDRFHFTYPTDQWIALSQSGVSPGYGVTWVVVSAYPPRQVVAAYTEPGSSAAGNALVRGEQVVTVDGVSINDATQSGVDTLNAGLFPANVGEPHTFVLQALNGSQRTVTMTSANVTETPVLNYQNPGIIPTGSGNVGYLVFNDHFATAESELVAAINTLQSGNVTDLVLDLRYNGGGYLGIASELAYMIAGSMHTYVGAQSKVFERLVFNSQYPANVDPVTGQANDPEPFYNTTQDYSLAAGAALPSLNLSRVFVITGTGTCSASESIVNGLLGVGVQVIQIGSTTCGKPYGFYPQDNCGTTYFSIEFQGVNDIGQGAYTDGFSPANTLGNHGELLPGCSVADDFTHALGDTAESRLAAALAYRTSGSCPAATGNAGRARIQSAAQGVDLAAADGQLNKGAWRENRILRH